MNSIERNALLVIADDIHDYLSSLGPGEYVDENYVEFVRDRIRETAMDFSDGTPLKSIRTNVQMIAFYARAIGTFAAGFAALVVASSACCKWVLEPALERMGIWPF